MTVAAQVGPSSAQSPGDQRVRARDVGIAPGLFPTGPHNAITDVGDVRVGQITRIEGADVRTGVTAILPHGGNLFQDKVPAGVVVANGFGKFAGTTQIAELGEVETPILLTNTLSVAPVIDGIVGWTLTRPGNEAVRSVNAVVGETNDSPLNNIRKRVISAADAVAAIDAAKGGAVAEGSVGAGTGTAAFGWKGGIGTSSRVLPQSLGGYRVGVLVQSNYGGSLVMDGIPVGRALGRYYLKGHVETAAADGSIILVVATDAPLGDRNLTRLAHRAIAGLARTGAAFSNGSGDYAIAFSTADSVRRTPERRNAVTAYPELGNDAMSPLFVAVADAAEEAIYNSLLMATTIERQATDDAPAAVGEAIDIDAVQAAIARHRPAAGRDAARTVRTPR
ncbi:MAG: P1 family peptidase [Sphingopyxis sp.]|uniref:P1 family peptidase n=1 Tax=Sphingopyxis sp. TaxID=1908224 RepID=UPI002AB7FFA5|nr:P1 family peptidase [Sphingopyxis sp.]MDZ3832296.1 P1 family peptidase [Sphingopyxis sp.]